MLQKGGEEPVRVPGGICHEGCEVMRAEGEGRWYAKFHYIFNVGRKKVHYAKNPNILHANSIDKHYRLLHHYNTQTILYGYFGGIGIRVLSILPRTVASYC